MTIDDLEDILNEYFDVDVDCYAYHLMRDKSAFAIGTMSINDFEEFDEDTTDDIAKYTVKRMNEHTEYTTHLLNVGEPIIVGGYINKVEVFADRTRYTLENGAVVEREKK